jgi:hypothetical protein
MVVGAPGVELEDELAVPDQPLVLRTAVAALTCQKLPVPAAARFHVASGDEGLHAHGMLVFSLERVGEALPAIAPRQVIVVGRKRTSPRNATRMATRPMSDRTNGATP